MAEKTSLAGERFEEEEVAAESFDKVFVNDIIKLINGSGIRNLSNCILYYFLGRTHNVTVDQLEATKSKISSNSSVVS